MRSHLIHMAIIASCIMSFTSLEFAGATESDDSAEPILNDEVIGISAEGEEIFLPVNDENDALNQGTSSSFAEAIDETPPSEVFDSNSIGTFSIIGSDDRKKASADSAIVQIQQNGFNH